MYQRMDEVLIRLPRELRSSVSDLAAVRGTSLAAAYRLLLDEALAARDKQATTARLVAAGQELDLHVLIAVEQVIALMESFLPRGQGAARRVLPEAVLAAQRRLELNGTEDQ